MFGKPYPNHHLCGLYYNVSSPGHLQKSYLPQVDIKIHANILATTSRTSLQQTFQNPSTTRAIRQVRYAFPLYEGVSVVGFECRVGNRLIVGHVKAKDVAKRAYQDAVQRGETAGLLEQLPEASDVFTATIGNIPPDANVTVNITYLGELKHDMEVDGIRFTIPTSICPRYGNVSSAVPQSNGTLAITVDAEMAEASIIQRLHSPSHPISMSMGTTSADPNATPSMSKVSAVLTLGVAHLETDFVLYVIAKDIGIPKAILEMHPTIPNQRALMATLVPKFALPPEKPEIVFVCDQSGSMSGSSMALAKEALHVFLKSLPLGVKFNICSFGSQYSFLFPRSASYAQDTLETATRHAAALSANYGGTEMLEPLSATIKNRYKDMPLDIILLTDGEIWEQQQLFDYLNAQIQDTNAPIRVFTLGIGSRVSHSLIEGIAKAGNGFAQSVHEGEKMNTKVVRMLKGALSPHVNDYTLEVKYAAASENDLDVVERVADSLEVALDLSHDSLKGTQDIGHDTPVTENASTLKLQLFTILTPTQPPKKISLFDSSFTDSPASVSTTASQASEDPFSHLPSILVPNIVQAPQSIPSLFAFTRSTVYLLFSSSAPKATPTSVVLRGTSVHGPLELEMPVQILRDKGETIHQLAAKKAVSELEQGRGWLASAQTAGGQLLKDRFDGRFGDMLEREAARLGVQFQVAGKWASFVATETTSGTGHGHVRGGEKNAVVDQEWEYLEDLQAAELTPSTGQKFSFSSAHNTPSTAGGFGAPSASSQPSTGGLCGAAPVPPGLFSACSASSNPFSGGLFGRSSAPSNLFAGSLFSAPPARSQPSGNSLFGATPASSQSFSASQFGAPPAPSQHSASSLFGASSASQPSTGGRSGSSSIQSTPSAGGLFGSSSAHTTPPTASLSGASSAAPFTGGLFGTTPAVPAFNNSSANALQDHQMGLMALHQDNPNQLRMVPTATITSASPFAPAASTSASASPSLFSNLGAPAPAPASPSHWLSSPAGTMQETTIAFDPPFTTADTAFQNFDPHSSLPTGANTADFSTTLSSHSASTPTPHSTSPPTSPQALLGLLIAHQSFTGAFPHHPNVLAWLHISPPDYTRALDSTSTRDSGGDSGADTEARETLLTTALVVVYIEKRLVALRGEWELVVDKARKWVSGECGVEGGRLYFRAAASVV